MREGFEMKLLGLSCGRKMQNTEVLVKEAMRAAEELGADVGMIRLLDLNIKPCTGCVNCVRSLMQGGPVIRTCFGMG
jgi:multimeric flavodoxin WrbA